MRTVATDATRTCLAPAPPEPLRTPTFSFGFDDSLNLDTALRIAGDLEDAELLLRRQSRE